MLDVNPDTVCRLIELAHEFHIQDAVVISSEPDTPMDDEWLGQVLSPHADDSTLAEFRSIIDDLEPRQQQQVVGLLWVGRGDYDIEEWEDALEDAADAWTQTTADYLIAHPMLADHLRDGLDLHGYQCE